MLQGDLPRVQRNSGKLYHRRGNASIVGSGQIQEVVPIGPKWVEDVQPSEGLADALHLAVEKLRRKRRRGGRRRRRRRRISGGGEK